MKYKDLIEHYGSELKAAAELGISPTTIANWGKADFIPRISQLAIQTLTKGYLLADEFIEAE